MTAKSDEIQQQIEAAASQVGDHYTREPIPLGLAVLVARVVAGATGPFRSVAEIAAILSAKPRVTTVTATGTVDIDLAVSDVVNLTIVGNTTLTFSNPVDGRTFTLKVKQGGPGLYQVNLPAAVRYGEAFSTYAGSQPPGQIDKLILQYDAQDAAFDLLSVVYDLE